MQVVDNRKPTQTSAFIYLPLGATYIDNYDCLCIKTGDDDERDNCLVYHADSGIWKSDCESLDSDVTVCPTTLIIEG